jgi:hypothetical protein
MKLRRSKNMCSIATRVNAIGVKHFRDIRYAFKIDKSGVLKLSQNLSILNLNI